MTKLRSLPTRVRTRLAAQEGISMIIALGVMFVTSLLLVAVFTTARGEIQLTGVDAAQKKAYYAAEAGIQDYEYHLTQDGNYLTYCTEPPSTNPALNQYYKEGTSTPMVLSELKTAVVPGSEEKYAIQLLPAESAPTTDKKCDRGKLVETMLEEKGSATGTFRIESTGFAEGHHRSLVATFRNANFVSYVWYTKFETFDPAIYGEEPAGEPTRWTKCEQFYEERPSYCANNYFINGELVNGPMHTEDHAGICGSPVFGRTSTDRIEFRKMSGADSGYSSEGLSCGGSTPNFKGTHILPAEVNQLEPPPGDQELLHIVESEYHKEGKTEIVLEPTQIQITNGGVTETKPYPPNGVIYVSGGCSKPYSPFGPTPGYTEDAACGNVYVHGEYHSSLTIAAENDVVINGNITTEVNGEGTPTTNAMLGLVANNFVRVEHAVAKKYKRVGTKCTEETYEGRYKILDKSVPSSSPAECYYTNEAHHVGSEAVDACDAPNLTASEETASEKDLKNPTIYAAILALKHAFVVDNFDCGTPTLESLNVFGAIAGLFSNGLTGVFTGSSSFVHGYPYNAHYDNRLQIEEPPHFLNPIQAAWYIQRETLANNP